MLTPEMEDALLQAAEEMEARGEPWPFPVVEQGGKGEWYEVESAFEEGH